MNHDDQENPSSEKNIPKMDEKTAPPQKNQKSSWFLATLSLLLVLFTAGGVFYIYQHDITPYLIAAKQDTTKETLLKVQQIVSAQQESLVNLQTDLKKYERASKTGD